MLSNTPRLPQPKIGPRRHGLLRHHGPLFHCRMMMMMILLSGIFISSSSRTVAFMPIVTTTMTTTKASYTNIERIQTWLPSNNFGFPRHPPPRRQNASIASKTTTTTTRLFGTNSEKDPKQIDVDGLQTAPYLFGFILLLCVWNFTIPTEFRRARLCSEQQVRDYPESNCKTWSQYTSGIQDYYRHGGTLFRFDFSVDRENNIWITGPQEILE